VKPSGADLASFIAEQLREIRRVTKEADEVSRRFRKLPMDEQPPFRVLKWIPIADD
jgi:hypothetical protein